MRLKSSREVAVTKLDVADDDVWSAVQQLDIPLLLIELKDFTVVAATLKAMSELNLDASDVIGRPIVDHFEDKERAQAVLRALASGLVDFYRTHRFVSVPDGPPRKISVWVRAIDIAGRRHALSEFSTDPLPRDSPLVEALGYTPPRIAVGTTDADGVIESVSDDVRQILGVEPSALIGESLLTTEEERQLCRTIDPSPDPVSDSSRSSISLNLHTRLLTRAGLRCIITCLADSPLRGFLLISGPDPATIPKLDRAAQLEHRLWRIASEVQASGIFDSVRQLPDAKHFPQLNSLTARQWEVLSRLLRGDRVASIARSLYVSESTVRNNLSDMYRIFGVHSQSELIDLLREHR